jgi:hypothetical protein
LRISQAEFAGRISGRRCREIGGTEAYARARSRAVLLRRRREMATKVVIAIMGGDIEPGFQGVNVLMDWPFKWHSRKQKSG